MKEYRQSHREEINRASRVYYVKNKEKHLKLCRKWNKSHPDKHLDSVKKWKKKHQEHIKKYNKEYRAIYHIKNRDKILARHKEYYIKNKIKFREYLLKKDYNITTQEYDEILKKQDNRCAICRIHQSQFKKTLCIDHNHNTGIVRGLLCNGCNTAIGMLNESQELFDRAKQYLKRGMNEKNN